MLSVSVGDMDSVNPGQLRGPWVCLMVKWMVRLVLSDLCQDVVPERRKGDVCLLPATERETVRARARETHSDSETHACMHEQRDSHELVLRLYYHKRARVYTDTETQT